MITNYLLYFEFLVSALVWCSCFENFFAQWCFQLAIGFCVEDCCFSASSMAKIVKSYYIDAITDSPCSLTKGSNPAELFALWLNSTTLSSSFIFDFRIGRRSACNSNAWIWSTFALISFFKASISISFAANLALSSFDTHRLGSSLNQKCYF